MHSIGVAFLIFTAYVAFLTCAFASSVLIFAWTLAICQIEVWALEY
jgi:hypothetical protein